MHFSSPLAGGLGAILGAIVERAEPAVPRHLLIAVIALIVAMMELVIERAQGQALLVFDQ